MKLPKIKFPIKLSVLDEIDPKHYGLAIGASVVFIVFMLVAGLVAFFLSLQGAEETMVPDLRGMDLGAALVAMQEKELYPKVQLRYSDRAEDRYKVLEQDPPPGSIVKAGRRINLGVSRGTVIDKVEDYVGWGLDDLKTHVTTIGSGGGGFITIKEPTYKYDAAKAGQVIAQKPAPGAPISGPVQLELVVSLGPERAEIDLPDLSGLPIDRALAMAGASGLVFDFSERKAEGKEAPGTVVSQSPAGGSKVSPGSRVTCVVSEPATGGKQVFGLLERELPDYPAPVRIYVYAELPSGQRVVYYSTLHSGGPFSMPYLVDDGTSLVLSVLDTELARIKVAKDGQ